MSISGARAAVLRIRPKQLLNDYSFSCGWSEQSSDSPGEPCSGQGLDAQEWICEQTIFTLGTQDLWAMLQRNGDAVPPRWPLGPLADVAEQTSIVAYLADGFIFRPPALEAGELLQLQFVAAWAPLRQDDLSTWFAVDLSTGSPRQW